MSMKTYEMLKDMMCRELDEISEKGELSAGDLEAVHKLTDTIKNIDKIMMLEEGDYSRDGEWEARGSYDRGNSYGRRGTHYVRGHYSRDGESYGRNRGNGRYSRDGGGMMQEMQRMLDEAQTPDEREDIQRVMDMMRR